MKITPTSLLFVLFLFLQAENVFPQLPRQGDSLEAMYRNSNDARKLDILLQMAKVYSDSFSISNKANKYIKEGLALAQKLNNIKAVVDFQLLQSNAFINDRKFESALSNDFLTIEIAEEIDDETYAIRTLIDIGKCYSQLNQTELAVNYLNKAYRMAQKGDAKYLQIEILTSLGNSVSNKESKSEALRYYIEALQLSEKVNYTKNIAALNSNIADMFLAQRDYTKSMNYYNNALLISQSTHNLRDEAYFTSNIGALYLNLNQTDKAEEAQLKALTIAEGFNDKFLLANIYGQLAKTYEKMDKYVKAYNYQRKLLDIELKTYNEQNARQIAEVQTKYETVRTEKELGDLKMQQINKDKNLQQYKIGLIALIITTILVVIILITLAAFSRQRKRLNFALQEKNKLIETQNKKITDSINYAKRIQDSILPEADEIQKILPQSFVLFQPKDIVSGDFFWLSQIDNRILIAVADCTGHGVPGAFMSMIGNTLLNEIINYNPYLLPSKILALLNNRVAKALHQKYGTIQSQDDGMDISLCCIDYANSEIKFAGANHSIYLIHNNEVQEIRGDIYSIGGVFAKQEVSFTDKVISIEKGAMLYLFTDGYKDQFGGAERLKFKSSRFEKLLLEIYQLPLHQQKDMLDNAFKNWKGTLAQLDDVLVAGIKL